MKNYFLIFVLFVTFITSCSSAQNNQVNINQPANLKKNNEQTQSQLPENITDKNSNQKFNPAGVVHFEMSESRLKTGGSTEATLALKIDEPYHVNSNPPSEKNFIPFEINFENANGIVVGKPIYPKGKLKTFAFSEKPLSIYADEFIVKLPLKADKTAITGEQILKGRLRFQPCDEDVCYPPQTVSVEMPMTVD
jgi:hypothetical protein